MNLKSMQAHGKQLSSSRFIENKPYRTISKTSKSRINNILDAI
jgi:hypothetical protein